MRTVRIIGIVKFNLNGKIKRKPVQSEHQVTHIATAKEEILDKYRQSVEQNHINDPLDFARGFTWERFEAYPVGEDVLMRRAGMPTLPGLE